MGPGSSAISNADLDWSASPQRTVEVSGEESEMLRQLIAHDLQDASRLLKEMLDGPFTTIKDGSVTLTESTLLHRITTLSNLHARLIW